VVRNMVLVCDADPGTQVLLFRVLAEAGYAVASAAEGAEAIAKIESDPPALIVANAALPGRSGAELCRLAKSRAEPIPVLLMAPGTAPEPIECADGMLGLPLDAVKVVDAVTGLLPPDEGAPPAGGHVLVIDDDVGILDLLSNLLGNTGYRVTTAGCGREGLEALASEAPDIVLLDVQMPGMSGFETLAKIREEHPDLPVVMITGHGSEEVAADALRLGADDYIAKPVRIRNLRFRVERNIEKARLRTAQEGLNRQLRQTILELTDRLAALADSYAALRRLVRTALDELCEVLDTEGASPETLALVGRLRAAAEADGTEPPADAPPGGLGE